MKPFLIIVLAVWGNWSALSQPPPLTPATATQEGQKDGTLDRRKAENTYSPTKSPASTINQATPTPTKNEALKQGAINHNVATFSWNRLNTGLLTLFNLLLVIVGFLQWYSMKKGLLKTGESADAATKAAKAAEDGVTLAKQTSQRDHRAWLAPIGIHSDVLEGHEFKVRVTFKNAGRTFATNVGIKLVMQMTHPSLIPEFVEVEKDVSIQSYGIVAPDGICYGDKIADVVLTRGHVQGLQKGQTVVYVHGRIEYTDVFKCSHWTTFCYRLQTDGNDPGTVSYAAYGAQNNQADDNC